MSSISSLAASLASAIEQEAKELEERREQLEREREQLNEEKRRMSNFAALGADLVKINVGGKVFQTHRATLLSAEGTLLESIFSGRWEDSLVRDEAGNVFFDFDPAPFRALLNYLRTRSLAEPGQDVPLPQVPEEHRSHFDTMVSFMGMQELLQGKALAASETSAVPQASAVPREAMAFSQAGCRDGSITIAGGRLRRTASSGYRCVIGGAPLLQPSMQQKLAWKVSIPRHSRWVLAGVTTNPAPPDNSQGDAGTYAWASSGQVWSGGRNQGGAGGWPGWQAGDVSIFQLDTSQQLLRMHLHRTGMVYNLPLPDDVAQSARLHFNLLHAGDLVEVAQATERELADVGF